jgi:hypothetical protein
LATRLLLRRRAVVGCFPYRDLAAASAGAGDTAMSRPRGQSRSGFQALRCVICGRRGPGRDRHHPPVGVLVHAAGAPSLSASSDAPA